MQRHRTLVVSTAAGLVVGVIGLAAVAGVLAFKNREHERQRGQVVSQRDRAETEAEIAKAVEQFLNKDLLAQAGWHIQAGPTTRPDPDLKVREALDRAAAKIGERFTNRPVVEASIRHTIGEAYFYLGLYPQALAHLERAQMLQQRELGADHPDTLETSVAIGTVYMADGKPAQAEPFLTGAMTGLHKVLDDEDPRVLTATHGVAQLFFYQGKVIEAAEAGSSYRCGTSINGRKVPRAPRLSTPQTRSRWSLMNNGSSNRLSNCWRTRSRNRSGNSAPSIPPR